MDEALEAVPWPGQLVRLHAAGSPQLPALILPAHTTQGPAVRKPGLSVVPATTSTAAGKLLPP